MHGPVRSGKKSVKKQKSCGSDLKDFKFNQNTTTATIL